MDLLTKQKTSREEKRIIMAKILIIKCSDLRYHDDTVDFYRNQYFAHFSDITFPGGIFEFLHGDCCDLFIDKMNMLKEEFDIEKIKIFSHEDCKGYKNSSKFKEFTLEQIENQIKNDLRSIKKNGIGNFLSEEIECFYAFKEAVTGKQRHQKIS